MKHGLLLAVACLALGCGDAKDGTTKQGPIVSLGELQSRAPTTWEKEQPSNDMRLYQFRLPKVAGDEKDGEVLVFKFGSFGGTAAQDVARWKQQLIPPEGKKVDDVSKVTDLTVSGNPVTVLDITGTYLDGPPNMPPERKTPRPNYRMVAVHFKTPGQIYHAIMRGPAKTVEEYKAGFDSWIKGFAK